MFLQYYIYQNQAWHYISIGNVIWKLTQMVTYDNLSQTESLSHKYCTTRLVSPRLNTL